MYVIWEKDTDVGRKRQACDGGDPGFHSASVRHYMQWKVVATFGDPTYALEVVAMLRGAHPSKRFESNHCDDERAD